MTNIIASSPDDYVSVVSLTPSAGFTLSDGLVVPSPILMIDGNCFLWDVDHPTVGSRPDGKPKSDLGFDWNGWSKDKLAIFETLSPRPGSFCPVLPSSCCRSDVAPLEFPLQRSSCSEPARRASLRHRRSGPT